MVYECDQCSASLPPGVRACPKCGEGFEDAVPADAEVPKRGFSATGSLQDAPGPLSPPSISRSAASNDYSRVSSGDSNKQSIHTVPPESAWNQKVTAPGLLALLVVGGIGALVLSGIFNDKKPASPEATSSPALSKSDTSSVPDAPPDAINDSPQLVKASERFGKESDYDIVTGEVTNSGSEKLDNLEAITTFYDSSGNVVKTEEAMVDFNPLLPGQTSPYKTMGTDNPLIKTEKTAFHTMAGPMIPFSENKQDGKSSDAASSDTASSAGEGDGETEASRDPVAAVASSGSGISDRPLLRKALQGTIVTKSDLAGKSLSALSISYNTIYAAHGYIFKRRSLQRVFDGMAWYHPNPAFAETDLSQTEKSNLKTIRDYERKEYNF